VGRHEDRSVDPRARPTPKSERQAEQAVLAAYDVAAEVLGNTRAVCRSCYVHPVVPESYRAGELADVWKRSRASGELDRGERAVLKLLGG
jgi:DNA topoisomerase-1